MDEFEEDISAWSTKTSTDNQGSNIIQDALKKERIIKDIIAGQDDLKVLVHKVNTVQTDVDKLVSENATLQMYIDNLTKQLARR